MLYDAQPTQSSDEQSKGLIKVKFLVNNKQESEKTLQNDTKNEIKYYDGSQENSKEDEMKNDEGDITKDEYRKTTPKWWHGAVRTQQGEFGSPYESKFKSQELSFSQKKRSTAVVTTHKILDELRKRTLDPKSYKNSKTTE